MSGNPLIRGSVEELNSCKKYQLPIRWNRVERNFPSTQGSEEPVEIISKGQRITVEEYALCFDWKNEPGSGFSFPCDKQGKLDLVKIHPIGQENLTKCLNGEYEVTSRGVRDYSYAYREPARGRCSCGRVVVLEDPMTNTCDCGQEYNGGGQLLAPRCQWEESWDDDSPFNIWGDDNLVS
jgi:hypothetical protein